MRSLPLVASFAVHAGVLAALCLVCARSAQAPRAATFLCLQEPDASPDPADPPVPEPCVPVEETIVEPEPLPDAAVARDADPIEFLGSDPVERAPASPRLLPAVRIAPLRHRTATSPAPPRPAVPQRPAPPPVAATAAVRVVSAAPRGELCRPPEYPRVARRRGLEGRVVLRVHVGRDGVAISVEVEESSGHAVLDEAAADAVRGWRFEPAREGGRAVESVLRVPIGFRLRA